MTNFPDAVDQRIVMIDPSMPEDVTVIKSFHAAMDSKNILLATQILRDNPRLEKMIFNAAKFNHLEDAVIAIQRMWNSDISEYLRVAIETVGAGVMMNQVYGLVAALAEKASTNVYTATIPNTGWLGSAAPYSIDVTAVGILSTDAPIVDIVQSGTWATDEVMIEDWGKITRIITDMDKITVYASEVPVATVPIQMKVVR